MATNIFKITIGQKSGEHYPILVSAPAVFGKPTSTLRIDVEDWQFDERLKRVRDDRASDVFLQEFGADLFYRLLDDDLRTSYELSSTMVQERGEKLQIALHVLAEELQRVPWELLYDPIHETWLSTSGPCPLSRFIDATVAPMSRVRVPLRVLLCHSEPTSLAFAKATDECIVVRNVLTSLRQRGLVTTEVIEHARRETLRKAIRTFRPHAFHFVGHSDENGLFLEKADRSEDRISRQLFLDFLRQREVIRLVVLSSCASAPMAMSLARHGMATVGMHQPIRNEAAIEFCRGFYEEFAAGLPVDSAVNAGRSAVRTICGTDKRDWWLPVVFLPSGHARLFQIKQLTVKIRSSPQGAMVLLDNEPTGRETPATVIIRDGKAHQLSVKMDGYECPPTQTVQGNGSDDPQILDFLLRPAKGFLSVRCNRSDVRVSCFAEGQSQERMLGITDQNGILGPVSLSVGRYLVKAVSGLGSTQTSVTKEVHISPAYETEAVLEIPESIPSRSVALDSLLRVLGYGRVTMGRWFFGLLGILSIAGVIFLVLIWTDRLGQSSGDKTDFPHDTLLTSDMVVIDADQLYKGNWDDSTTVQLLRKHGLDAGAALREMLTTEERAITLQSYLIDKHEVTNAQYRQFLEYIRRTGDHSKCHPDEREGKDHTPKFWDDSRFNGDDLPVVGVDWFDAYAYASWAGKRLPTTDEWEYAACGEDKYPYPWGREYSDRRYYGGVELSAPLSAKLLTPPRPGVPVGMAGNVAEWTISPSEQPQMMIFRGGAWNHSPGDVYGLTFLQFLADQDVRDDDLGLRCVQDVTDSLPTDMVLIEGGTVRLGGENTPLCQLLRIYPNMAKALLREKPEVVSIPAFSIDRCEVTNSEYRVFLEYIRRTNDHSRCHPDEPSNKDHIPQFWYDPQFNQEDQPVVGVDYYDAYAYAAWADKRIPTADQWELAARGTDKRLYPWGNEFEKHFCVCLEASYDRPATAKYHEHDCSPFGVVHLAGNVMEWTSEDYNNSGSQANLLKGGSWTVGCEVFGLTFWREIGARRLHRANDVGFRCIRSIPSDEK